MLLSRGDGETPRVLVSPGISFSTRKNWTPGTNVILKPAWKRPQRRGCQSSWQQWEPDSVLALGEGRELDSGMWPEQRWTVGCGCSRGGQWDVAGAELCSGWELAQRYITHQRHIQVINLRLWQPLPCNNILNITFPLALASDRYFALWRL